MGMRLCMSHRHILTHETHSFIRLTAKAEQTMGVKRKDERRHQFQTTEEKRRSKYNSSSFKVPSIRFFEDYQRSLPTQIYFVFVPFLSSFLLSTSSFVSHYQSQRRGEYTWFCILVGGFTDIARNAWGAGRGIGRKAVRVGDGECLRVDSRHNVLYLVIGHPLVMGYYFHFVKSNKTYNNPLTIHPEKLIFELFNVLHLVIIIIKNISTIK